MTHDAASLADVSNSAALERIVEEINDLQSKLILLVGRSGSSRLINALAQRLNVATFNISMKLGQRLARTPIVDRGLSTSELLREITNGVPGHMPLVIYNLEALFEPSLQINPLNVIKRLAHSRRVIAAWPGEMRNDRLIYAAIGHPEYRDYSRDGVVVFETTQR